MNPSDSVQEDDKPLCQLVQLASDLSQGDVGVLVLDPVKLLEFSSQIPIHDLHLFL